MLWRMRITYGCLGGIFIALAVGRASADDPWADAVVSYAPGTTAAAGFTAPLSALGSPARFTNDLFYPSVVSIFSPPFLPDQIVSVGEGGQLTIRFDEPIVNDPAHLFGIDFILFGNSGFIDFGYPNGQQGSPARLFGAGLAGIEVSADGSTFLPLSVRADGLFPTQGYLDGGPFDALPGSVPTDFLKPVNPALTLADFNGLSYVQSLTLYAGSGGGTPLDIGPTGLGSVSFVRISLTDDADPDTSLHAEIDALAAVPEPAAVSLLLAALGGMTSIARNSRQRGRIHGM